MGAHLSDKGEKRRGVEEMSVCEDSEWDGLRGTVCGWGCPKFNVINWSPFEY